MQLMIPFHFYNIWLSVVKGMAYPSINLTCFIPCIVLFFIEMCSKAVVGNIHVAMVHCNCYLYNGLFYYFALVSKIGL